MDRLTIGIDAGPMMGQGGVHGYVEPLVRALIAQAGDDEGHRLLVRRSWRHHAGLPALQELAPVFTTAVPDSLLDAVWARGMAWPLPRRFWQGLDLFLSTCLVTPHWPKGRVVSIVYDMIPSRLPNLFPDHAAFEQRLAQVVERSDAVIAISECSRRDLVELLGVDEARIRVIYPGRDAMFRPSETDAVAECRKRYGIETPYFLYIGSLGPHKNVATMLRAFERFRAAGGEERLVLAGGHRWGGKVLELLEQSPARDAVILPGFVPDADLPHLYSGANGFLFPSFYEGFGFPVLEAMACGAPVITTSGGALPEVAGEAGIIVDPHDDQAMADAMMRLSREKEFRGELREAGFKQAERFSWRQSAEQLSALLHEVGR
jgi:glycosyltransferase involved in cell wall biosynthesis